MEKTYTEKFREAYRIRVLKMQEYTVKNDLVDKTITSLEHPDYFKIDEEWEETRKALDKPLLEKAYYKIGDSVYFVKQNTYGGSQDLHGTPAKLLKKKGIKYYTIFDANDEDVCFGNPDVNDCYYENRLTIGTIAEIKTSDCGSGEILYMLKNVSPACPESNPYVMETDIITVIDFYFNKC